MAVNLFPASSSVFARLKSAKAVYLVRVQAWDDQGNPWIVGVPDLGHDLTKLLQANLLPEFRKLKPGSDADLQNDPADALPVTPVTA
jgi:hypothetical protein